MSSIGKRATTGGKSIPVKKKKIDTVPEEEQSEWEDDDVEAHISMLGKKWYALCSRFFTPDNWENFDPESLELDELDVDIPSEELKSYPLSKRVKKAMQDWAREILEDKDVNVDDEIEEYDGDESDVESVPPEPSDSDGEEDDEEDGEEDGEEDDEEDDEEDEGEERMESEDGPANAIEEAVAGFPEPVSAVPDTSNDADIAAAVNAGEDEDDGKRGAITKLRRQLETHKAQNVKTSNECARLKEANATLVHALRQNQIPVPEGAIMVAGEVGSLSIVASALVPMTGIAPPPPDIEVPDGTMPFIMRMCNLPDTSGVISATRFELSSDRWPHTIQQYKRGKHSFAPHVEKRAKQNLKFAIFDKRNSKRVVTEKDLIPNEASREIVPFTLSLIYDDDGEPVTMQSLCEVKRKTIATLSKPDIIGKGVEAMRNGCVAFQINNLYVLSSMTKPMHRKFRWKVVCTHPNFKDIPEMSAESPGFYSVARSKTPQLHRKGGPAGSSEVSGLA